jgi:CRISPR-associated protein Cmr6
MTPLPPPGGRSPRADGRPREFPNSLPLPFEAQKVKEQFKAIPADAHAGLWHEKFFNAYDSSWQCDGKNAGEWLANRGHMQRAVGNAVQIASHLRRVQLLCESINGQYRDFATEWHFATGLGNPHAAGNGFVWHPTLGVPYLPASGVKGLLNGWLAWQDLQRDFGHWLGTSAQAGALVFFDALPVTPVVIGADVMTPHMGEWYENGAHADPKKRDDWKSIPADWHEPKPFTFLVVKHGLFRFTIAPTARARENDVADAFKQLGLALEFLGAGAKTAAGYGRMTPHQPGP